MPTIALPGRAILEIAGPEARDFLDRVVSCAVEPVGPGRAAYGALLSPQGKILSDFLLFAGEAPDTFYLDAPAATAGDLRKRLGLYRLRARLTIEDRSETLTALASWDEAAPADALAAAPDPRHADLGLRAVVPAAAAPGEDALPAYEARRIALGIPEAGLDFALGDAFPHEALLDQLHGVDFGKGCYVGQEVVSRMQHRGTARTRVVSLVYLGGEAVPAGEPVTGGERALGQAGSGAGPRGLALLRIDRAGEALDAGEPILAGGRPVRFDKPAWATFRYPGEAA